jgi:hypothetical protein
MIMQKINLVFIMALFLVGCAGQKGSSNVAGKLLFHEAAEQYRYQMTQLPAGRFPRNFDPASGKYVTSGSEWWCSGFYPGTLLYLYEQTGDTALYREALRMLALLEKEKNNKSTHDLGFMMFCSFGNAARIAPKPEYNEILMTSARSLSTRFNPAVGAIKSWDSKATDFLVIIDNMMNLDLLFWATKYSGDSSFYKIAITHANTTLKNHFRPDASSYHVVNYDPVTGGVQQKRTAQGAGDETAWARGQAWGLYGYTATYRATKDARYLEQAQRIADFMLRHPNLPADKIPYWDFNAPGIPDALRDASAAAITASALLELKEYVPAAKGREYNRVAQAMVLRLSHPDYRAKTGTNGGYLLKHSVGHKPGNSEVDVALTYADYYFTEALIRIKEGIR